MVSKKEIELLEKIKLLKKELDDERIHRKNKNVDATASDKLLVVSNRLPINLTKDPKTKKWTKKMASGGLVSAMSSINFEMQWIGYVGFDVDEEDKAEVKKILSDINCVPVFIPKELYNLYYNGFSNDILWPVLHYNSFSIDTVMRHEEFWSAYVKVNNLFCTVLLELMAGSEVVWVHDYHLMLLPGMLRKRIPKVKLGWFLHTPFPESDVFRVLPRREKLLKGLLACDLVGFHIFNYARHFKNACSDILGCETTADSVEHNGRLTMVDAFPIGIDNNKFEQCKESALFKANIDKLRERYGDARIIVGVDRLDYIKGIMHKLVALENFFESNARMIDKVTYVQIAVPSRTDVPEYQQLGDRVHELVGRINGKFSNLTHVPIHYLDTSVPLETLVALYCIADVCLITSLRDGMNLVSYEYVASQAEDVGVLILSEFVGAAQSLGAGSLQVNPWDVEEVSGAILKALLMPPAKREKLFGYSKSYITEHSAQNWAEDFLFFLNKSWDITSYFYREFCLPEKLDFGEVRKEFDAAGKKIMFLGLMGTLSYFKFENDKIEMNPLSDEVKQNIKWLVANKKTEIVITTSRSKEMTGKLFEDLPVILLAENGYYLKDNRAKLDWIKCYESANLTWIESAEKVMIYFVERTPSSFIERQETAITWHYEGCTTDFSEKQARDLVGNLQMGPLINTPTEVIHDLNNRYVKVSLLALNKGSAILSALEYLREKQKNPKKQPRKAFLQELSGGNSGDSSESQDFPWRHAVDTTSALRRCDEFDFVLCVGSNFDSDEESFKVFNEKTTMASPYLTDCQDSDVNSVNGHSKVITVSVGKRKSLANFYLKNVTEVSKLLREIAI